MSSNATQETESQATRDLAIGLLIYSFYAAKYLKFVTEAASCVKRSTSFSIVCLSWIFRLQAFFESQ